MSEPIQPAHQPNPEPAAAHVAERTPGVSYEKSGFDFWLIVRVGAGLVIIVVVVQIAVWWLLVHDEIPGAAPPDGLSTLALADARRPLGQRLLDVPAPLVEGIERENSRFIVRTGERERQMGRFGWADRAKGIVRIPVATAMEEVLKSKEFGNGASKKSNGRSALPARANSGRGSRGGKP